MILLIAHKKHLPQFADKIAELEAAGVTVFYFYMYYIQKN